MDWLSYSDSAVLLLVYRRLCAPDCVVFLPYRYDAVSVPLVNTNTPQNWIIMTFGGLNSRDVAHMPCRVIIIIHTLIRKVNYCGVWTCSKGRIKSWRDRCVCAFTFACVQAYMYGCMEVCVWPNKDGGMRKVSRSQGILVFIVEG